MQRKPVIVIQGAQFGSEAKGAIAAFLCKHRKVDYAVRTGAINAGHTVYYRGLPYAMQQLPTGWVNPATRLVIGPGAYIHPPTLWREIDMVNSAMPKSDVRSRLYIDYRCGLHDVAAEELSKAANRHHRIGATGKGCSEAIVNKIRNRNDGCQLFRKSAAGKDFVARSRANFVDTVLLLNDAVDQGAQVLIEGTQGTMLDLHIGPYPFTTSRMTSAANWIAEAGLSPSLEYEVVLVARTFPIRVAGNSGPMPDEIEWTDLARDINKRLAEFGQEPLVPEVALLEFERKLITAATSGRYPTPAVIAARSGVASVDTDSITKLSRWVAAEREVYRVAASELHRDALNLCDEGTVAQLRRLFEMTTVTKKLRRIARLDIDQLRYAIAINRPKWIALTFLDYVEPVLANTNPAESITGWMEPALVRAREYVLGITKEVGVPVGLVSTGPEHTFIAEHLWAGVEA